MSLETSIAALTTQAGLLMDLPNQVAAQAQTQIAAVGQAYQGLVAGLSGTFYVNQTTGVDTAAGTIAAPLRSIEKALSLVPYGGFCEVRMQADYTLSSLVLVSGRMLSIVSDGPVRHNLNFDRILIAHTTPNQRHPGAFNLHRRGSLRIEGLTINVPVLDGQWSTIALAGLPGALINEASGNLLDISILNCSVVIPANPFCPILMGERQTKLYWAGNTLAGAITDIRGRISADQLDTAGVATNSLPWLVTNLTSI